MESTFKIESKPSSATCFIIGKPSPDGKKLAPVLITADHVLTRMPEDVVTLVLRQKGTNGWTRLE